MWWPVSTCRTSTCSCVVCFCCVICLLGDALLSQLVDLLVYLLLLDLLRWCLLWQWSYLWFVVLHRAVYSPIPLLLKHLWFVVEQFPLGWLYPHWCHFVCLGYVVMVSGCTNDVVDVAAVTVVSCALPFNCAFWYCSHLCSNNLQWFNSDC